MIHPEHIQNRAVVTGMLTDRQEVAFTLVESYYRVACEMPSAAWLSRRMGISPKRAWEHMDSIRRKVERRQPETDKG